MIYIVKLHEVFHGKVCTLLNCIEGVALTIRIGEADDPLAGGRHTLSGCQ